MVKRFKYRLERVLAYRELVKDEKLKALMLENRRLNDAEGHLKELETAILLNQVNANTAMAASEIDLIGKYSQRLKLEIEHQKIKVLDAKQAVASAREIFIEASKDAEMLEKLKSRKQAEYLEYIKKEDEKFLDEIMIQRTGIKNSKE